LVLGLRAQGFRGQVVALSRRGLLSQAHREVTKTWPTPRFSPTERGTALALLQAVRAQARQAQAQGVDWRAVIDSLRPITAELWLGLSKAERARFVRHSRPYWDIHRHRAAPTGAAIMDELRTAGRLHLLRGRITEISQTVAGLADVTIAHSVTGELETLRVQRVIYATGLQGVRAGGGLLAGLLESGLVRLDSQELGLDVDEDLAITDAAGHSVPHLWALGPLVRGVFWECLAVPDIRVQAQKLAAHIAETVTAETV
jgi:uncharacterized NAD(P)/FAD-binding protein YdhS